MIVVDDRQKEANGGWRRLCCGVFHVKRFRFQIPSVDVLSPTSTCRLHLLRCRRDEGDGLQLLLQLMTTPELKQRQHDNMPLLSTTIVTLPWILTRTRLLLNACLFPE
jgi:hypothetical protein